MDYNLLHGRTYMYSKDKPLYAFGYGLSYTTFEYKDIHLDASSVAPDGQVNVTVKVRNTGKKAGDEVVQIYVQHLGSSVERPQLELEGFKRVHIEANVDQEVHFIIKPHNLAYWDTAAHMWRVEKEKVRLLVGGSSDNLPIHADIQVETAGEYKP